VPLIARADHDWTSKLESLPPGDHVAILSGTSATGVRGRLAGLELRDTLTVLIPGPGVGFVFLFRRPFSESTVVAQTLKTGTGGLNIGGCRVGLTGGTKRSGQAEHFYKDDGTEDRSRHWARTGHTVVELATGRWPPNVLLVHAPECERVGTKKVETGTAVRRHVGKSGGNFGFGAANPDMRQDTGYADADGLETVPAWSCGQGCPVPIMDALSGDRPVSGRAVQGGGHNAASDGYGGGWGHNSSRVLPNDVGGASRFYPQFDNFAEMLTWLTKLVTSSA
jgi:hypothetical protein